MISDGLPEVEIFIPSSCFIRRDSFDSFSCAVDIFPERSFPLELVGVAQKANLNRLYAVRLRMKGATGQMPSPGMTAMVDIYLKPGGEAMVAVPLSAVFEDDGDTAVWVYSANTQSVARRRVDVGAALADGTIVVTAGLTAGESVVSAGVHSLTEGEVVKPLPAVSPSNVGGLL
jgi:multidrug efflux pump subunit AcrA (membrane-fusion protein)